MDYAGRITVEDAKDRCFQIHEYRGRRFLGQTRRFVLDNGERVKRVNFDNYFVARTGDKLLRID